MVSTDQNNTDDTEDISYQIWAGTLATVIPATFAVVLRFLSRWIAKAGYWWDDWVIVVSLFVNWGLAIARWVQVLAYGFGKHARDLPVHDIVNYQKSFLAVQLLYFTNTVLTKSSLLLFYHRLFGVIRRFRQALLFSTLLLLAYFVACVITSLVGCSPVSYFWTRFETLPNPQPDHSAQGDCINEVAFFRWNGVANMLLDILVLLLPLPVIWRMRTATHQKILLKGYSCWEGFFGLSDRQDPTFSQVYSSTWSSVEQGTGIVCACLPTLRPLGRVCGGRATGKGRGMGRGIVKGSVELGSGPGSKRSSGCQSDTMTGVSEFELEAGGRGDVYLTNQ
ncbi:hypothetical protein BJX61DRAFT_532116 [Aspergillus egyptiacus]|nr:hypothetical protein BJX61DRAFT_532116 [Aspergillus egyptiacus]